MAIGKLFKGLFGGAPAQLVVEGVITESGEHQPRTHLGPNQAPVAAYFALDIAKASLSTGREQPPSSVRPAEFSGERALLDQFAVGDRVRIVCSTATGREIAEISAL